MIPVFKFSESVRLGASAPEGQTNQPTTLCAGREVSTRCEQFHRAAEKDMFRVNLKKKKKGRKNNQFGSETSVWRGVEEKSTRIPFKGVSWNLHQDPQIVKDQKLSYLSGFHVKNLPFSSDLTQTWSFHQALPESLLFILPYPGCVQSIHNCPVFLINHKRFLFCLQLVLG